MRHTTGAGCWLLAGMLAATSGLAEEYNFEIGLAIDSAQFDGSQTITTAGGTIFNSGETDTDDLGVSGSWYFAGLSDDKGPRARAVLVDRASSLSFGYLRSEQTILTFLSSDDPAILLPSLDSRLDADRDSFIADFRYVHRDSGWFGNAGILTSKISLGGAVSGSVDATGWSLGVGKYLFETTTLGLDVEQVDVDGGGDLTIVAASFSHLGNLGERWQYAIDLGFSRSEADGGFEQETWGAAIALYPTRDFEFGVAVEDVSGDNDFFDTTGVEAFASWFMTPNVRLSARYRVDDVNYFGNVSIPGASTVSDADQNSYGISASVRF